MRTNPPEIVDVVPPSDQPERHVDTYFYEKKLLSMDRYWQALVVPAAHWEVVEQLGKKLGMNLTPCQFLISIGDPTEADKLLETLKEWAESIEIEPLTFLARQGFSKRKDSVSEELPLLPPKYREWTGSASQLLTALPRELKPDLNGNQVGIQLSALAYRNTPFVKFFGAARTGANKYKINLQKLRTTKPA